MQIATAVRTPACLPQAAAQYMVALPCHSNALVDVLPSRCSGHRRKPLSIFLRFPDRSSLVGRCLTFYVLAMRDGLCEEGTCSSLGSHRRLLKMWIWKAGRIHEEKTIEPAHWVYKH